jgi:hypothetical protein
MVDRLTEVIAIIIALSVASERLVEIIEGVWGWLDSSKKDDREERWRKVVLHVLAVIAGIITAWLASGYVLKPEQINAVTIIGLGILASGGSSFWNSILTYLSKVKDMKKAVAEREMKAAGLKK